MRNAAVNLFTDVDRILDKPPRPVSPPPSLPRPDKTLLATIIGVDPRISETAPVKRVDFSDIKETGEFVEPPEKVVLVNDRRIEDVDTVADGIARVDTFNDAAASLSDDPEHQQAAWLEHARRSGWKLAAETRTCNSGHPTPTLSQLSCADYIGAETARWRETNREWDTRGYQKDWNDISRQDPKNKRDPYPTLEPSKRQGLMCLHNVGAGKTATFLRAAIKAREAWSEVMVIYTTDENILSSQMDRITQDYPFAGVKAKVPPVLKDEGRYYIGTKSGKPAQHWVPTRPYEFGSTIHQSFAPFSDGTPSVIAVTTDQLTRAIVNKRSEIKKHWSVVNSPSQDTVIKLPDRPILLFIDEAHLLVESRADKKNENYEHLFEFLSKDQSSAKGMNCIYNVLLTSTPGSTHSELARLCKLVTTKRGRGVCERLKNEREPSAELISEFSRAMYGCVDVWMMLSEEVYPVINDDSELLETGKQTPLPAVKDVEDVHAYVARTCYSVARKSTSTASRELMALCEELKLNVIGKQKIKNLGQLLYVAVSNIKADTKGTGAVNERKVVVLARLFSLIYHADTIAHIKQRARKHGTQRYGSETFRGIVKRVEDWAIQSRDSFLDQARNPDTAASLHPPSNAPLTQNAPKLALLAWRIMRGCKGCTMSKASYIVRMQQVVTVPLPPDDTKVLHISSMICAVLENTCGIHETNNSGRWPRYLDVSRSNDMRLVQPTADKQVNENDRTLATNYARIKNNKKDFYAVVLLPNSHYAVSLTLRDMQRVHVFEWGDDAAMNQGVGRVQRPCIAGKSGRPPQVNVYRYIACDGNRHDDRRGVLERSVARHLRVLEDETARRGQSLLNYTGLGIEELDQAAKFHMVHARALNRLYSVATEAERRSAEFDGSAPVSGLDVRLVLALMSALSLPRAKNKLQKMYDSRTRLKAAVESMKRRMAYYIVDHDDRPTMQGTLNEDSLAKLVGEAWKATESDLLPEVSSIVSVVGKMRDDEVVLERAASEASRAMKRIVTMASDVRVGRAEDDLSIDEALIRAYVGASSTMNTMIASLFTVSVSCLVYKEMHQKYGQLPGLPNDCNIARSTTCNIGEVAPCNMTGSVSPRFRSTAQKAAQKMAKYRDPDESHGRNADPDILAADVMQLAVAGARDICKANKADMKKCEEIDPKTGELKVQPGDDDYDLCMQLRACKDVDRIHDALDTEKFRRAVGRRTMESVALLDAQSRPGAASWMSSLIPSWGSWKPSFMVSEE